MPSGGNAVRVSPSGGNAVRVSPSGGNAVRVSEVSLRFDVVTLFPEIFSGFLSTSLVLRALREGLVEVHLCNLREFGVGKHRNVDDTPYGGGSGMVLRVDVLVAAMESLDRQTASPMGSQGPSGMRAHRVLLTPQGRPLDQSKVLELSARRAVALVCGRYEGFDERVRGHVDEEISLGDFVMIGGEVAAMAIVESCARLIPGVLGNESSSIEESHSPETSGLLEYPQYTRPQEFRGEGVPSVLQGGNHAEIARWRREQAEERTRQRRPDLLGRIKREDKS